MIWQTRARVRPSRRAMASLADEQCGVTLVGPQAQRART